MKILFICKKHWKLIQKQIKTSTSRSYEENPMFPALDGDLYGLDFSVYIKPYLKKPRMIDPTPFKFDLTSYSPLPPVKEIERKYPELFVEGVS